jgi:DNA-binding NarL/FixJ family response regulator
MRGVTKNYNYRYKDHSKLTPSEEITYKLMQKGLSNKQIAAELNLKNVDTIRGRVKMINEKLQSQMTG